MICFPRRTTAAAVALLLIICSNHILPTVAFVAPRPSRSLINQSSRSLPRSASSSSPSSKETRLNAALIPPGKLTAIGAGLATFYKTSPLIAGFVTASTKAALADSMAQYRDVHTTQFDLKRMISLVLYSGTVLGIFVSVMYNTLFPILFAGETDPFKLAIKMTLFDGFVNAPLLWLPPAYIVKALIYNYPKRQAMQKYIADVKEKRLLIKYWSLWIPVSIVNFLFVPEHFRVAFVAAVSFFWMIILSLIANKSDDKDKAVEKA